MKYNIDNTIAITVDVWTNLIPPRVIAVPVSNQESEWSCICVLGVSILLHSTIFPLDCGNVPTVRYYLFFILFIFLFFIFYFFILSILLFFFFFFVR